MVVDVNVLTSGWTIAGVIASFLVAVVALGLGVSSFIQTKNLQKKERRERVLNEIIEWAIEILKYINTGSYMELKEIELIMNGLPSEAGKLYDSHRANRLAKQIGSHGMYIERISRGLHNTMLTESINAVRKKLFNNIRLLDLCIEGKVKNETKSIHAVREKLGKEVENLINLASDLLC